MTNEVNSRVNPTQVNPPVSPRKPAQPWLLAVWAVAVYAFLYLPIVVLIVIRTRNPLRQRD
ncbi:hypothetical protein [Leptolyngbya sp. 7M]|uniref:hypothetical protein n=1 Tax=Leptolyngbya sp. 7M TaxID=2812896 RepID=UPI001B8C725A|nr:hypothetical protein [Leptolyngbya sp. 7M]QYO67975.1 hypothetical protein JVX88_15080 [Leptolyngbya sp. 7M]